MIFWEIQFPFKVNIESGINQKSFRNFILIVLVCFPWKYIFLRVWSWLRMNAGGMP